MKSIWKNMIINIVRMLSSILFPILIFPYVSRVLGPNNLGKVDFANSIMNYFVLLSGLGIPTYGLIACAKVKNNKNKLKRTICELLYINTFLMIISYIVFILLLVSIPKFRDNTMILLIYSFNIVFTALGIEWLYSALEEYGYITKRSILFKIISLILIFTLIKDKNDYIKYALILVFSTVGSNILNFWHARNLIQFYKFKDLNLKKHILPILTFFSASVASTVNANTDTIMLGFIHNDYSVGIYSFAVKIKTILVSFITAALTVTIPKLSQYAVKKDFLNCRKLIVQLSEIVLYLSAASAFFFSFFSKTIILILGGKQYLPAQLCMIILNMCLIILGYTWILGVGIMQPFNMQNKYAKTMWRAMCINIILNIILIPFFGSTGAAIATFISELFNLICFWHYTKTILNGCIKIKKIFIYSFASLFSSLTVYNMMKGFNMSNFLFLIIAAVSFFVLYNILLVLILPSFRKMIVNIYNKTIIYSKISVVSDRR